MQFSDLMTTFALILALTLTIYSETSGAQARAASSAEQFERLKIKGVTSDNLAVHGIFDPSVAYVGDVGYMSYSGITIPAHVSTLIATTRDGGRNWRYLSTPNPSRSCTTSSGKTAVCRYETSALVHLPTVKQNRRWQLYAEVYPSVAPHKDGTELHGDGVIEVRYANHPKGPWGKAECMFGPRNKDCRVDLRGLHPDLKDIKYFNEMGVLYTEGALYMSLDASATTSGLGAWKKRAVILIASNDGGQTWDYRGVLTDYKDANNLGYVVLTASSLAMIDGRAFLVISPSGAKGLFKSNKGHDGTYFIPFQDIGSAKLLRDGKGALKIQRYVSTFDRNHGMSDFDGAAVGGGLIQGWINLKDPRGEFFQLWRAKKETTGTDGN